jgi:DNA helicase-2/ATP-dependent DNA helicase PcrA
MGPLAENYNDHFDDHVDDEIRECFNNDNPMCFFTFAGAGSGKTRSLVNTLSFLKNKYGTNFALYSKQIAVITYTNAACDEILSRVEYSSIFAVSTIHSFLWELVKNFQIDIKKWIKNNIISEISELEMKQSKGKTSAASLERQKKIESKRDRFEKLDFVKRIIYNPNGDNYGYDTLNHSEVIKIGSEFIASSDTLQKILISRFPILLIDESQDTKKELIDALLILYEKYKSEIIIGMFGDTMQKIYTDGKEDLAICIPDDWKKPTKKMNHRSSYRIVELANSIRNDVDGQEQNYRSDVDSGVVRLFIVNSNLSEKNSIEIEVVRRMYDFTGDEKWLIPSENKCLILEHQMAASRLGFIDLYSNLYEIDSFKTGLLDGTLPELHFLTKMVLPLIKAFQANNEFEVTKIVRRSSPLLEKSIFATDIPDQFEKLDFAEIAVNELCSLWGGGKVPTCLEILRSINRTGLFKINDRLREVASDIEDLNLDEKSKAVRKAFMSSFLQLEQYYYYINSETPFATHQGVKGLEYPRVVVIMDDFEARGFLFSYEKLFGAKEKSETDLKNEIDGKETSITRTKRLFYVACTRAKKSLAMIAYTTNVLAVKNTAKANGWFKEDEIIII